jgi:hypothetical protein
MRQQQAAWRAYAVIRRAIFKICAFRNHRHLAARSAMRSPLRFIGAITASSIAAAMKRRGGTEEITPGLGADPPAEFARCFLRLANLPNLALDRLNRYEVTLCRQIGRTLFAELAEGFRRIPVDINGN